MPFWLIPLAYQPNSDRAAPMSKGLDLRQLRCFVAVAEELNFRRAAERLHMTQPPLSRQMQQLEHTLGTALLERNRQGVALTAAGRCLLVEAHSLLGQADSLLQRFRAAPRSSGIAITLGVTTVVEAGLFAWVQEAFERRCPGARLTVKRQISARSIADLRRGAIDVAVIGLPSRAEGLTIEPLFDDPMRACIASTHCAARKRRVSVLDLNEDNLFWFDRKLNPAYDDHCRRVFERVGFKPRRIAEPADHHVLLGLIAAGEGVALVPKSLGVIRRKGVVFRDLLEGERLCIRVGVACRSALLAPAARQLVEMLKAGFSGRP